MKIINEANEKFKDMQDEICGFLFDLLRKINEIEESTFQRSVELRKNKEKLGIPRHIIGPGENELWDEFKQQLREVIPPHITEKLRKRGFGGSFGDPATYFYIDGECTVNFIMKSAARAVVITHYSKGIDMMHKFVIKNEEGKWLVDAVYYGFESKPDKWSVCSIQ